MGPAYTPAISPPNVSPNRSETTEASASFIAEATGAANVAHELSVPLTQSARVSTSGSPGAGSKAHALSSHRFASLAARRTLAASCALTVCQDSSSLARSSAMVLASFTLIGPRSTACCISISELRPPSVKAFIIARTSSGLGRLSGFCCASWSRTSCGSWESCCQAISPWIWPKQSMSHWCIAFSSMTCHPLHACAAVIALSIPNTTVLCTRVRSR